MISSRYAWHACVILALGLVPTAIHVYAGPAPVQAGALAARVPDALGSFTRPVPGERSQAWAESVFGTRDYVSRGYAARKGAGRIEFFAATSYDWKKLFHFPENGLARGHLVTSEELDESGAFPVRVLEFKTSTSIRIAVYGLLYGAEPVTEPITHVLREVPTLFVSRRKPMTLLYAQMDGKPGEEAEIEKQARSLIAAAAAALRE